MAVEEEEEVNGVDVAVGLRMGERLLLSHIDTMGCSTLKGRSMLFAPRAWLLESRFMARIVLLFRFAINQNVKVVVFFTEF